MSTTAWQEAWRRLNNPALPPSPTLELKALPFSVGMDMVSLLDDSLESEIAVLMMILAATTAAAGALPQMAEPSCSTDRVFVALNVPTVAPFIGSDQVEAHAALVSKIVKPDKTKPENELFGRMGRPSKGPAVLTPECRPDEAKKKDYPLA